MNPEIGTIVKIAPEWQDEVMSNEFNLYVITEWNGDRGFIQPLAWTHGGIRPTELVREDMIEIAD
jgi:hypothetical protein